MTAYDVDAKAREAAANLGLGHLKCRTPESPICRNSDDGCRYCESQAPIAKLSCLAAALREARETAIDQVVSKILEVETVAVRDGASAEARQWLYGARSAALYVKSLLTPSEKETPDAS